MNFEQLAANAELCLCLGLVVFGLANTTVSNSTRDKFDCDRVNCVQQEL